MLDQMRGRRLSGRLGAAACTIVVLLGAAGQSGLIAPKWRQTGSGGGSPGSTPGSAFTIQTIENVSWPSWTVTGVRITNMAALRSVATGPFHIGLLAGDPNTLLDSEKLPPLSSRLSVHPGDEASIILEYTARPCPGPTRFPSAAALDAYMNSHRPAEPNVSVELSLDAPLGYSSYRTHLTPTCQSDYTVTQPGH